VTREDAWEPWLLYMLRAVEDTATWTTAKIGAIRALAAHTTDHVRRQLPKIYSRELVDIVFEQPLLPHCQSRRGRHRGASSGVPLPQGARIGRSIARTDVGREKLILHPRLMTLLTRDGNSFDRHFRD
jgi:hypothetical protein